MRILKAYSNTDAPGRQNLGVPIIRHDEEARDKKRQKQGGDTLNISEEARNMLANGSKEMVSACPQDATYDQFGNMTRQFEEIQNDLRSLAAQFNATPQDANMRGKINGLRAQLAGLQTHI